MFDGEGGIKNKITCLVSAKATIKTLPGTRKPKSRKVGKLSKTEKDFHYQNWGSLCPNGLQEFTGKGKERKGPKRKGDKVGVNGVENACKHGNAKKWGGTEQKDKILFEGERNLKHANPCTRLTP